MTPSPGRWGRNGGDMGEIIHRDAEEIFEFSGSRAAVSPKKEGEQNLALQTVFEHSHCISGSGRKLKSSESLRP